MFKEIMNGIEGIEILPNLSLIFFFVLFVAIIIWVFKLDKSFIYYMKHLPLENDKISNSVDGGNNV